MDGGGVGIHIWGALGLHFFAKLQLHIKKSGFQNPLPPPPLTSFPNDWFHLGGFLVSSGLWTPTNIVTPPISCQLRSPRIRAGNYLHMAREAVVRSAKTASLDAGGIDSRENPDSIVFQTVRTPRQTGFGKMSGGCGGIASPENRDSIFLPTVRNPRHTRLGKKPGVTKKDTQRARVPISSIKKHHATQHFGRRHARTKRKDFVVGGRWCSSSRQSSPINKDVQLD